MQVDYNFVMKSNILLSEGKYCWDAGDPGGPTNFGITCYDLAAHRGLKMDSMAKWAPIVKAMTVDEALDIYATKYAVKCRFNDLASGVDYTVLDYGINSGVARPPLVLSKLLGLPASTVMTDQIVLKTRQVDPKQLIASVNAERLHFMHQIRGGDAWTRFGKGWGDRVNHVITVSDHLVDQNGVPQPQLLPQAPPSVGKAIHVADPAVKDNLIKGTGGATVGSQGLHHFLTPSQVIAITAGVVIVGVGAIALHSYLAHRKNNTVVLPPGVTPLLKAA
jgi:lysozyme family protein